MASVKCKCCCDCCNTASQTTTYYLHGLVTATGYGPDHVTVVVSCTNTGFSIPIAHAGYLGPCYWHVVDDDNTGSLGCLGNSMTNPGWRWEFLIECYPEGFAGGPPGFYFDGSENLPDGTSTPTFYKTAGGDPTTTTGLAGVTKVGIQNEFSFATWTVSNLTITTTP